MPQVFTGKVVIPGDQIEAYLAAMMEAEVARAPFRAWYKRKVLGSMDPDEVHAGLKKFFQFLDQEKGIHAPKALEALR